MLDMLKVTMIAGLAILMSSVALAHPSDLHMRKQFMESRAKQLGIDTSTPEGREQLRTTIKAKRTARAAELGFDLNTEEGRQAFKTHKKEKRTAHAAELGYDLNTQKGRAGFKAHKQEQREKRKQQMAQLSVEERSALRADLQGLNRQQRREVMTQRFGE